jgi:hypothetical protein
MNLHDEIQSAQVRAGEDAVIASIPVSLKEIMDEAQAAHEARGGCPGCGSMVHAVPRGGCPTLANNPY